MLYVLICGHASHAPDLAFVLACGSLMQLRIQILSSALLASAFEMSTLRPWPRHTSAHSASLGHTMDPSAFCTDERIRRSKSVLPICQPFTKQKRKIQPKKGRDPSCVRHRLLREQRGKVCFAQGLRQKAQQRHQTRLWGRQTISDHVRLSKPCFPGFSQLIFSHGKRSSQGHGLIGGVGGGHVQQQWRPGVPLFNLDLAGSKNITG